jgi:hypothetical protein
VVTSALVGVAAGFIVSDGAQALVDGNYLACAVRSLLEAHIGALSRKAKFKLTNHQILR